jgi:hypothetical protein
MPNPLLSADRRIGTETEAPLRVAAGSARSTVPRRISAPHRPGSAERRYRLLRRLSPGPPNRLATGPTPALSTAAIGPGNTDRPLFSATCIGPCHWGAPLRARANRCRWFDHPPVVVTARRSSGCCPETTRWRSCSCSRLLPETRRRSPGSSSRRDRVQRTRPYHLNRNGAPPGPPRHDPHQRNRTVFAELEAERHECGDDTGEARELCDDVNVLVVACLRAECASTPPPPSRHVQRPAARSTSSSQTNLRLAPKSHTSVWTRVPETPASLHGGS